MTRLAPRALSMLIGDVLAQDRARFAGVLALALGAALVEGFGILSLVPVAALAVSPDAMRDVPVMGPALSGIEPAARLPVALLAFVILMTLRALVIRARTIAQSALLAHYDSALRLRAVSSLASRHWAHASAIGRDGMQALLHNDVPRATTALQYSLIFTVTAILLAVQIVLAAFLSLPMTLAVILILFLGLPVARIYFRRAHRSGESISQRLASASEAGTRLHDELKSAKAQGTTALFLDRYRDSLDALRRDHVGFGRDHASVTALSGLSAALAAALLVWAGVKLLRLELPAVLGLLLLFSRMSGPAQVLVTAANNIAAYAPSFASIVARLGHLPAASPATAHPTAPPLAWSRIELRDASLELGGTRLLDSIDFTLGAGEWVAIEGPSGAGKTSLLDLVAGLHPVGQGHYLVDGAPLGLDRLPGWQAALAYVGQDEMIHAASLRDNLGVGVSRVDPALLDRALHVSGLADLIAGWPEGLDLPLADRGRRLSGGERQRVGIARALLRDPRLLILDEATAALDLAAEATLFERLRALPCPPALLLVSHRPQTAARCDRRLTIANGRLVP